MKKFSNVKSLAIKDKKKRDAEKREIKATFRITVIVGTFLACELVGFKKICYFLLKIFNIITELKFQ